MGPIWEKDNPRTRRPRVIWTPKETTSLDREVSVFDRNTDNSRTIGPRTAVLRDAPEGREEERPEVTQFARLLILLR